MNVPTERLAYNNRNPKGIKLLITACILCNLSQIPILFDNPMIRNGYYIAWILLFVVVLSNGIKLRTIISNCKLPIIFDLFCIVMWMATGRGYVSSDLFQPVNLSTFILMIGIMVGSYVDDESMNRLSKYYVLSVTIVALYIYYSVFRGADWASSGAYLYASKNSAGQIFLTALVLAQIYLKERNRVFVDATSLFFVALILMMKSRTTVVTLVVMLIYYFVFIEKRSSVRISGVVILVLAGVLIWSNSELHELIINQIMLNNRDARDISAVTSNRDIHFQIFQQNFKYYMLTGTGGTYLESMPLSVLLSYGLIGGVPLLLFSIFPIRKALLFRKNTSVSKELITLVLLLGITMFFNGVFEEQSPFGPGVKCYFLWLTTGIMIGKVNVEKPYA